LTRPGIEPAIFRIRGEHANYYMTDAGLFTCIALHYLSFFVDLPLLLTHQASLNFS
jgi:hypothetical protein